MRKRQLIEAGLIPNISETAEEGDDKKTGSLVSRKRKVKKVKEEVGDAQTTETNDDQESAAI